LKEEQVVMIVERQAKEDGRYIIFYTFEPKERGED
jgi:hypothetical protein